jgi:hypothetical protein
MVTVTSSSCVRRGIPCRTSFEGRDERMRGGLLGADDCASVPAETVIMVIWQRPRVVATGVLGLLAVGLAGGAVIGAGFLALTHAVEADSDRGGPASLLTGTPPDSVVKDATVQRRLLEGVSGVASVEVRYRRAATDIDRMFPELGPWEPSFLARVDAGFDGDGLSELRQVVGASDMRIRFDGTGNRARWDVDKSADAATLAWVVATASVRGTLTVSVGTGVGSVRAVDASGIRAAIDACSVAPPQAGRCSVGTGRPDEQSSASFDLGIDGMPTDRIVDLARFVDDHEGANVFTSSSGVTATMPSDQDTQDLIALLQSGAPGQPVLTYSIGTGEDGYFRGEVGAETPRP